MTVRDEDDRQCLFVPGSAFVSMRLFEEDVAGARLAWAPMPGEPTQRVICNARLTASRDYPEGTIVYRKGVD